MKKKLYQNRIDLRVTKAMYQHLKTISQEMSREGNKTTISDIVRVYIVDNMNISTHLSSKKETL